MARKPRYEGIGYYHIINRGVERRNVFLNEEDYREFMMRLEKSADIFRFTLHAYCLMPNHYHLLIETTERNLSQLMKQLNAGYSIYFNKKYKRVGPLWQGRFKSWYVHNLDYLETLYRYIESNPVKAGLSEELGLYPYASAVSGGRFGKSDEAKLEKFLKHQSSGEGGKGFSLPLEQEKEVEEFFPGVSREQGMIDALRAGLTQKEIAAYLGISAAAVSKAVKKFYQKGLLFERLKKRGLFWSYDPKTEYSERMDPVLCENVLKYGDFDELVDAFSLYGKRTLFGIWEKCVKNDGRFKKLNLFLARIFFGMDVQADFFKGGVSERERKLRMLAS